MANIDKRIVEAKFDNASFERNVATTMSTLDKFKAALGNIGSSVKNLGGINIKTNAAGLEPMSRGVDALVSKFSALQIAGVTAIATIANKAVTAGINMGKSLTIAPISGGLGEYEKKLGSIQTILSNTQAAGTNLKQVSGALNELNTYSDKTIYNFGEMARNIGTFTAAGVDLKTATGSIKGIANLAALSGSSSEQASVAMYQLSQAISAGRVSLMDWNSVVNAGMGGTVFQRSLAETAIAMGKLPKNALKLEGAMKNVKIHGDSFRNSISGDKGPSWLTSDVLTKTLKTFTGDMTEAQLVAEGFSKAQAKALYNQGLMAQDAATKVKTGTQLMSTLKETAESGWASTWEMIVGDFVEAPKLWTGINDAIGGIISSSAQARNHMLHQWKSLGGRTAIIDSIRNAWQGLGAILKPIGDAFRTVFPSGGAGQFLADFSFKLREITSHMKIGKETAENIKRTFQGLFSLFKIGLGILGGGVKILGGVFGILGTGAGGGAAALFELTAKLGDAATALSDWLNKTGAIKAFFAVMVSPLKLLKPTADLIMELAHALTSLLSGDMSGFREKLGGIGDAFKNMFSDILGRYLDFSSVLSSGLSKIGDFFTGFADRARNSGNELVASIAGALGAFSTKLSDLASNIGVGIANLMTSLTGATGQGKNFLSGFGSGAVEKVISLINRLRDAFKDLRDKFDFSDEFKSFNDGASTAATGGGDALATVGGVLTAIWGGLSSIFKGIGKFIGPFLSEVGKIFQTIAEKIRSYISGMNSEDAIAALNTGTLIAMVIMFRSFFKTFKGLLGDGRGMFGGIAESFGQLTGTLKSMQNAIRASVITQIAIAVGVLVAALFVLAKIDSGALKTALITLGVLFAEMAAMMKILAIIDPKSMVGAGVGMIAIATAITILSVAIKRLGEMDQDVLIQGGLAIASIMAALAGMAKLMTYAPGIFVTAAALVLLSVALTAMAGAIALYAAIPAETLMTGVKAMAITLIGLGIAMSFFTKGAVAKAVGITIMAVALTLLSGVLITLGSMPNKTISEGIKSIAVALAVLVIAAQLMRGALPGAAAMIIMAGAIAVLAPAIALLGALPMDVIKKGLIAIAAVMGIFVVSMYLLTPVIVTLALFSKALLTLGLAMLAAGAGFALFVGALAALTVVGAAGFAVLTVGIIGLINLLPLMAQQVGYAIVTFANVIAKAAPKVAHAMGEVVMSMINEIAKRVPEIYDAGLRMIIGLLTAIRSRIGTITNLVIDIIAIFINTLAARLGPIIQAGVNFIVSFVNGVANAIRTRRAEIGAAGANLARALVEGLIAGLRALWNLFPDNLRRLAADGLRAILGFFGINSPSKVFSDLGMNLVRGLINGVVGLASSFGTTLWNLAKTGLSKIKEALVGLVELGASIVKGLVSGVVNSASFLYNTAKNLITNTFTWLKNGIGNIADIGLNIVQGLANGITNSAHLVKDAAINLAKKLPGFVKKVLGIESPSKEFMKIGEFINEGLIEGLTGGTRDKIQAAMEETARLLTDAMSKADSEIESSTKKLDDLTAAQAKNTAQRKIAQKELTADQLALRNMTAERNKDEAAIKKLGAEVAKDKQRIKDLTSARVVDTKAVKEARAELAKDETALRSLTGSRQADLAAIKAKSLEIDKDKERLRILNEAQVKNTEAIKATTAAIAEATSERNRAALASDVIATKLEAERNELDLLADSYTKISEELDEANKTLEAAIKTRDDYAKSITDKYSDLPDINDDTTLMSYLETLQKKVDDTNAFSAAVQQLRDMGLNDASYKELIEKGVDALPFVNKLLEGGQSAVDEVNAIGKNLIDASTKLGAQASAALYEAGVQTAQGLVNGLNSQLAAVQAAMAALAAAMTAKIEAELQIKSPSRVMAKIGAFTVKGLVNGLKNSTPLVGSAASDIGSTAVSAMREAMTRMANAVDANMELAPTITPVLDLSNIRKDALKLDSMMNVTPISVGGSYSRAAEASQMYQSNREAELVSVGAQTEAPSSFTFIQNNTSPKALSEAEIYRMTNNQLSVAKGALTKNAS